MRFIFFLSIFVMADSSLADFEPCCRVTYFDELNYFERRDVLGRANSVPPGSPSLWPGGLIRYKYASVDTATRFENVVEPAILAWSSKVACLHFSRIEPPSSEEVDGVVTIRQATEPEKCASRVGFPQQ